MSGCCSGANKGSRGPGSPETVAFASRGPAGETVRVKGGASFVGTNEPVLGMDGEGPERKVQLRDFDLEVEAVTNRRFAEFVSATGYVSESERFGFSSVFAGAPAGPHDLADRLPQTPWWKRGNGASWKAPEGPGSSIEDRLDHPVVQVSWNDAVAFAEWVGGRLPTEAEWEHAARGGNHRQRYPWGDEEPDDETVFCNIWQGRFPQTNTLKDGYLATAPVRSFSPSAAGFFNLAGNVWEWTGDPFRVRSLTRQAKARNDQAKRFDERVLKGGSFLCHKSYCYRYRIAARMGLSPDSAASNMGFRVAYDARSEPQQDV